ncbi:MAG: methyltransferase domain-containing protein [Rhodospirillales bacterium]|nr:methyltransferase domain-containing protein [Rhodospirillales bacterium]
MAKPGDLAGLRHADAIRALLAGEFGLAEDRFRQAVALRPDFAEAHNDLGLLLVAQGRRGEAIPHHVAAIRLAPERALFWFNFAAALNEVRLAKADPGFRADLLRALAEPGCDARHLVAPVLALAENDLGEAGWADPDRLAAHPLAMALLARVLVADRKAEDRLTALRRLLLERRRAGQAVPRDLALALARQAYYGEYAWAVSAEEEALLAGLDAADPIGAAYRPSASVPELAGLMVDEPAQERRLATELAALTPIEDAVSRAVRAQYETHPYPRWIDLPRPDKARPLDEHLALLFPGRAWPTPAAKPLQVLIAGAGTGLQSILAALRYADSQALGIDLSRSSLAYAERQRRRLGVDNLAHAQADILRLRDLGRRFHLIECYGVLHHMADPLAGLAVLADILEPGGYMLLGLYSERARQDIVAGRAFIALQGFAPTDDGIRQARQAIRAQDPQSPLGRLVTSVDFYSLSLCRDLLFHVQEHRLTLPAIAAMLEQTGLEFLGFDLADPATHKAYRARFPTDRSMVSLANWAAFEADNPSTFASTYRFWVRKPG